MNAQVAETQRYENINPILIESYIEAVQNELESATKLMECVQEVRKPKTNAVKKSAKTTEARTMLIAAKANATCSARARDRIYHAVGRDTSPIRHNDFVLETVYAKKITNKISHPLEYDSLAKSIKAGNLGNRLKTYFKGKFVPEYAVGYFRGTIVVGSMEIDASPMELFENFCRLLPLFSQSKTSRELIRSIYRFHYDSLPEVFNEPGKGQQIEELRAYCSRGLPPQTE